MIETNKFKIKIAKNVGFCFGVKRAINLAERAINKKNQKVYTLGPIIHNPQEVKRLKNQGIAILKNIDNLKNASVILRTHGIPFELHKTLIMNRTIDIIDATCPFVKRAQKIVWQLSDDNIKFKNALTVLIGEKIHPEVIALVSYATDKKCLVLENIDEARFFFTKKKRINVVSQTTQTPTNFNNIVGILKKRYKVKVYNTICEATLDRQESAKKLSNNVDLMIVVGGKNSGNTTKLAQICSMKTKTYHIETVDDLKKKWFKKLKTIGLVTGASTPSWIIKNIINGLKNMFLCIISLSF
jgi:4-hydroxy-3-methylbut-2-enyl diphosphate reductase